MSNHTPAPQYDMATFQSRFVYRGNLTFHTAHRIGSERTLDPTVPDLPILRSANGAPFIPGSSFKGAWRAFSESLLRTLNREDHCYACDPLDEKKGRCLSNEAIRKINETHRNDLPKRDQVLRQRSCLACQIFGNQVLSSKVFIKDLDLATDHYQVSTRDGVSIDRDLAKVAQGPFQYEVVSPGAAFAADIVVENGTAAQLAVVMLGLEAFAHAEIRLGGFKSRGLGVCTLVHDWPNSRYLEKEDLLDYLFDRNHPKSLLNTAQIAKIRDDQWIPALEKEIGRA